MNTINYIGLDAHSSTCTFCVMDPQGKEIDNKTILTNGRLLINYIKSLRGNITIAFEECDLSCWLFDIFKGRVDKIVVCNPSANAQYKRAKTDKIDARNLANLLRGGFLKPVFHDASQRERLRMLTSSYEDNVQEVVRIKNRLSAIKRKIRLSQNKKSLHHAIFIKERLTQQLDLLSKTREQYKQKLRNSVLSFKESRFIMSIPGLGHIHTANIIAQIIDPNRFKSKYKLFAYCGLVKHNRVSANRKYGSTRIWGNRKLKCVFKMAAHSAIKSQNSFNVLYHHLREKGISDKNAHNTVARRIAVVALSLWKNEQYFKDELILENIPAEE